MVGTSRVPSASVLTATGSAAIGPASRSETWRARSLQVNWNKKLSVPVAKHSHPNSAVCWLCMLMAKLCWLRQTIWNKYGRWPSTPTTHSFKDNKTRFLIKKKNQIFESDLWIPLNHSNYCMDHSRLYWNLWWVWSPILETTAVGPFTIHLVNGRSFSCRLRSVRIRREPTVF